MTKDKFIHKILIVEIIGFFIIILIVWIDELLDLPHLIFGSPVTSINYFESIFETFAIAMLSVILIFLTHKILKRLRYLEGILPVCSFCKKIRVKDHWIPIEQYIHDHSEADFSHGVCPECAAEHYGDLID